MDRLAYLATRDERAAARPSGPSLAAALADRGIACIRIRARYDAAFRMYHDLGAWTTSYRRIFFDVTDYDADQKIRAELVTWWMELHPEIDWTRDHQIIIATGEIQAAPEACDEGWIPEDDLTFGGTAPVLLPQTPAVDRRAA